ncbi:YwaF family protein [Agrococcus sp. KRD186]|uniref:YwaF family protein n=1 Tax=Agrococcus sp. KRD186 TaxID=2729730 RepID=UPI001F498951|nr:TIGR02206 family membrane protein [Agrococcus sp. KRD186]
MILRVVPIDRMQPYGVEHMLVLAVTVVLIVALPLAIRRAKDVRRAELWITRSGWMLLVLTLLWMAWGMLPANWDINESLPFHFSDALRLVTAIALITRSGWAIAVSHFWGLTLNLQSFITPDLNYFQVPALEFAMYWLLHIAALLAPVVLVWGLGFQPTWFGYGTALVLTVSWAAVALVANSVTGANYGYLSRAPEGPSILDALGPWPIYIGWEAVLVAGVWALMTVPWTTRMFTAHARIDDRLGLVRRRTTRAQLARRA